LGVITMTVMIRDYVAHKNQPDISTAILTR
jgi:hypothetical protein